ncbi:inorganic phosphate transporter [Helicobacter pametensis]|uniref:inorganic phosphate transporter n=1 Tax=Helicobacter pametensis TaxID=95149 RepID=UPI000485D1B1|nr:inorganic phosphate transporter [Helicobacter pametensis]
MDIKDYKRLDRASRSIQKDSLKIGIVMIFVIATALYAFSVPNISNPAMLVFATIVGGYMAMNIGANDVANNVGPAVGSKAITLFGAIIIAAICEAMGAIIAGGDVVDTVKSGIISQSAIADPQVFLLLMFAALLSAALWLNLATFVGAPVSTTHSLVGGILGAGIAAGGVGVVKWGVLQNIVLSWVISPVMGGLIAVVFLMFIKKTILYKKDKREAARKIVPILIAVMSFSFSLYLITKGLKKILPMSMEVAVGVSVGIALVAFLLIRPWVRNKVKEIDNTKEAVNDLFTIPLVFAAALLSFAHGANDVANAIGPLAAINQVLSEGLELGSKASVPLWIMVVGALGISLGLALYGPKLIKTVGNEITDLDKKRAFCVAMSAAITVLIASQLGLPVSSTHIAIGGIFGVGFLREYLQKKQFQAQELILQAHAGKDEKEVEEFLEKYNRASMKRKGLILEALKRREIRILDKKETKKLKKAYKNELVKRSALTKIVASWLITVPVSALLGGGVYYLLLAFGL